MVDPRTWQALFECADEYVDAEPWLNMGDAEIFGVYDANSARSGWGVALGQLGENYGLGFYQELEGLYQLKQVIDSKGELFRHDFDYVATMNMLNFNWVPRNELRSFDVDIIRSVGWPTNGDERYHQFISYRPGYAPWPLDESEARFMLRGLEAGMLMAKNLQAFKTIPSGMMPLWKFENDDWNLVIVKPDEWQPSPYEPAELDEVTIARIKKKVVQKGTWEAGHFYQHSNIMDMERPYHLHIVALVDSESHYALPPMPVKPIDNVAQVIIKVFVGSVEKEKRLPSEVVCSDHRLMQAVSPVLEKLNIKTSFSSSLPAIDDLKENMRDLFLRGK